MYHHQTPLLRSACAESIMTVWICFHLGGHKHDRRLQRDQLSQRYALPLGSLLHKKAVSKAANSWRPSLVYSGWTREPENPGKQSFKSVRCHSWVSSDLTTVKKMSSVISWVSLKSTWKTPRYAQHVESFKNMQTPLLKYSLFRKYILIINITGTTIKKVLNM